MRQLFKQLRSSPDWRMALKQRGGAETVLKFCQDIPVIKDIYTMDNLLYTRVTLGILSFRLHRTSCLIAALDFAG